MCHLLSGLEREAGAVRHYGGEHGLEAEGEEGVEPEHEAVAAGADVAGNLETGDTHDIITIIIPITITDLATVIIIWKVALNTRYPV